MTRTELAIETAAILIVAGVGVMAARAAFVASPPQMFYQSEFGPAVMVAAGRGFVNPRIEPGGALAEFLAVKTPSLDTTAARAVTAGEPDQFQHRHRYLLMLVGYWWRIGGIAWARLAEVAGLLHAAAVVSTFAIIRLFAPAAIAAAGALWFALSPLQLSFVPHLRDFSKGAFVLAVIPLMVVLVERPMPRRWLAAIAALAGAIVGIGIGFKFDVAIMAALTAICVIAFRGPRPWLAAPDKLVAVAALLLALLVSSWPVMSRLSAGGSNAMHVVLLGYADWFDTRLGVDPAPYTFTPYYSDEYLQIMLRVRALQESGADALMPSAAYDAAGLALWQAWLRHFPADAVTRLLAAMNGVLNLAFDDPPGAVRWLSGWRGWGWLIGVAIVLAAARAGVRRAMFAVVVLLALAGYPSLQFDPRHYFHLQAIPIAALLIVSWHLVSGGFAALRKIERPGAPPFVSWPRAAAIAALLCTGMTVVAAAATRTYQSGHLEREFGEHVALPGVAVTPGFTAAGAGTWLAQWPGMTSALPAAGLSAGYYVAEFMADGPRSAMAIGLRYREAPQWSPCASTQNLVTGAGVVRFLFPAYSLDGVTTFDGVEMGDQMRQRLIGIRRLNHEPSTGPSHLRLAADWQSRRLFQRLTGEERFAPDDLRADTASIRTRCAGEIPFIDATLDPQNGIAVQSLEQRASGVAVGDAGIVFDGSAERAAIELARFTPIELAGGDSLVVRLDLERGSVVIGLRNDNGPSHQAAIPRPGVSVVVVRAAEAGRYRPVIESGEPGRRSGLRFTVDRAAIVAADGSVRKAAGAQ